MERPNRKRNRLEGYDYSQNGCYFVTVCTAGKEKLFWKDRVGADGIRPYKRPLNHYWTDETGGVENDRKTDLAKELL